MDDVLRTENHQYVGLPMRLVRGMNVFEVNGISVTVPDDPRITFLRELATEFSSSAHIGATALMDFVDEPSQMFGFIGGQSPCWPTLIDISNTQFKLLEASSAPSSCFFPRVMGDFWMARTLDKEHNITNFFLYDALALYVHSDDKALAQMRRHMEAPFPGNAEWLHIVTDLYKLAILTSYDGWYMEVYAKDAADLELIASAIDVTEQKIKSNPWFTANQDNLRWSGESDCLLLHSRLK